MPDPLFQSDRFKEAIFVAAHNGNIQVGIEIMLSTNGVHDGGHICRECLESYIRKVMFDEPPHAQ